MANHDVAQIIVDVPLMQTDQAYSYLVPDEFKDLLQAGMRVHVPFGRGGRLVQGIFIGFATIDIPEKNLGKFKAIFEVLDLAPVLTEEQLWLAQEMRKTVFAYKISILKAMLPSLLNSTYDKILTPVDGATRDMYFDGKESARFSTLSAAQQATMMTLYRKNLVTLTYQAKSKENIKTESILHVVDATQLAAASISKGAKKRLAMQDYLVSAGLDAYPKADLIKAFSRPVVNWFVDMQYLREEKVEVRRADKAFDSVKPDVAKALTAEQGHAIDVILSDSRKPILLEGVTGSGKTEVYLQAIEAVLKQGKTAIVLVPEISLTPQITNRFIARFGRQVAILHSRLSDGERYDEWRNIEQGKAKVVVGARSAIFAPLTNIGLIVIDEEHEQTYKQDTNPRYHARDVAMLRAQWHGAKVLLGSATPSLETRARAQQGVYDFVMMRERANSAAEIPQVQVIDFKANVSDVSQNFTPQLLNKIQEKLDRQEQIVLMLNRRGYSSFVMCRDCGYVVECPNCDVSLTLHRSTHSLNCHYCGHMEPQPSQCPNCQSTNIRDYGTGTEKVEQELGEIFPDARVLRMDVDTTSRKGAHEKILDAFEAGKADILLGTQMIAKGLDFPNVTLVGVINADTGLNLPDFRASERTFQLLTQVAGRAGRADKAGEVIIQTYNPDHYALQFAQNHDYEGFYQVEMGYRQKMAYPPYYYTVQVVVSHSDEQQVLKASYEILADVQKHLSPQAIILGPIAKGVARTHNQFHYQLLIKYKQEPGLAPALNEVLAKAQGPANRHLKIAIDYEPQNFV